MQIAMIPDIDDIPFLNIMAPPAPPMLPPPPIMPGIPDNGTCPDDQFLCGDEETCVLDTQKCDGNDDCPASADGSVTGGEDEEMCSSWLHPSFIADISGQRRPEPEVTTKGWYPGPDQAQEDRDLFDSLGCKEHFLQAKPSRAEAAVSKECMRILKSISFLTFQGAHLRKCDCHQTGSTEGMCDKYYGGCSCKNLVVGRRCDSCAPASYGFSSSGCIRCECDGSGSQNEFCNQETGQCTCNTKQPTFGRRCNECKPGYWNFPNCQQCKCNGHADICEPLTGNCVNCRDSTMGDFCDTCKIGFYGRPARPESPEDPDQVPCRECKCPDTQASGHSFAWENKCDLNPDTMQSECSCMDGYTGDKCDQCMDNFFGHPEIPGGECKRCDCSQNWIESEPGNCDHQTGECLKCVYETEVRF